MSDNLPGRTLDHTTSKLQPASYETTMTPEAAKEAFLRDKSYLYNEDLDVWAAFEKWARDNLGQGYSLGREEGVYTDPVTVWAYQAWKGRDKIAAAAVERERERCAKLCEALRDEHCASTAMSRDNDAVCHPDDLTCDFVVAWNDAAAAIRKAAPQRSQTEISPL